jgi:hypothetical protein
MDVLACRFFGRETSFCQEATENLIGATLAMGLFVCKDFVVKQHQKKQ